MTARFELDETKAATWLAEQMALYEKWLNGEVATPPELEVSSSYDPRYGDEGVDTATLVGAAHDAGLITGPGTVDYDHCADPYDVGYLWILRMDGPGRIKLATYYEKISYLGDGEARGADAALSVLREAVSAANGLLDDLDAYVAAQAG